MSTSIDVLEEKFNDFDLKIASQRISGILLKASALLKLNLLLFIVLKFMILVKSHAIK